MSVQFPAETRGHGHPDNSRKKYHGKTKLSLKDKKNQHFVKDSLFELWKFLLYFESLFHFCFIFVSSIQRLLTFEQHSSTVSSGLIEIWTQSFRICWLKLNHLSHNGFPDGENYDWDGCETFNNVLWSLFLLSRLFQNLCSPITPLLWRLKETRKKLNWQHK